MDSVKLPSNPDLYPYTVIFWDDVDHKVAINACWAKDPYDAVIITGNMHFNYEGWEPSDLQLLCVTFGFHDLCVVEDTGGERFTWFPQ
jgi:hypothetical protein